MSTPITKRAWLPPERAYEQEIVRWIGTPQEVEDWFVRDLRKSDIPDDYLIRFHDMLKRVTKTILVGPRTEACFITFVIRFGISILRDEKAVVLKSIITRPCAERQGFARIVIFHLMRICYAVNYDLILDEPSIEMIRLLETAFDRQTVHKLDLSGTNRPTRVDLSHGRHLGNPWVVLSDTLPNRLCFEPTSLFLHDWAPPSVPYLRPECFPSAGELNNGPAAKRAR